MNTSGAGWCSLTREGAFEQRAQGARRTASTDRRAGDRERDPQAHSPSSLGRTCSEAAFRLAQELAEDITLDVDVAQALPDQHWVLEVFVRATTSGVVALSTHDAADRHVANTTGKGW
jgi:hypothetical protein